MMDRPNRRKEKQHRRAKEGRRGNWPAGLAISGLALAIMLALPSVMSQPLAVLPTPGAIVPLAVEIEPEGQTCDTHVDPKSGGHTGATGSGTSRSVDTSTGDMSASVSVSEGQTGTAWARVWEHPTFFSSATDVKVEWRSLGFGSASWSKTSGGGSTQGSGSASSHDGAEFYRVEAGVWTREASGMLAMAIAPASGGTDRGDPHTWTYETGVDPFIEYRGSWTIAATASAGPSTVAFADADVDARGQEWCTVGENLLNLDTAEGNTTKEA